MPMVFPTISIHESFAYPTIDVPAQPDGDGYRGDDPRPADGCGDRDRRLRQDPAGADHGGGQRRPAGDRASRSGPCSSATTRARCSAPAPIAAACGARIAPARSTRQEIEVVNGRLAPSVGTCMVMGTASTMACITEAMGLSLPMCGDDPGAACRTHADGRGERQAGSRDGGGAAARARASS